MSDFSHATSALEKLRLLDAAMAEQIKCGFVTAKHKILLRFEQGAAYYAKFPWNIVKLLGYIVAPGGQARERAIQESKAFAAELCGIFDSGQLPTNTFAQKFFQEPLLLSLRAWADDSNNRVMHEKLFSEVLSYGLSLVSMQRLEGRHHLVNLKVAPSRASTATTISAALRRRQNRDVYAQTFRDDFEHNLQNFQLLVPESWSTMAELHRLISGQHLEIMFQDVSHEELVIRGVAGSGPEPFQDAALVPLQQHVKTVLKEGRCYAVPVCADGSGGTVYHILQLLSSKPSAKKYIERVVGWGDDKWAGQVAVASLGRFVASAGAAAATVIDLEASVPHDAVWQLCPYPSDHEFTSSACSVQAYPVHGFFKYNFEHVYEFQGQTHVCEFSEAALADADALGAEEFEPEVDSSGASGLCRGSEEGLKGKYSRCASGISDAGSTASSADSFGAGGLAVSLEDPMFLLLS